ncbi:MAG: HD domain-containing protein [Pseudomonadota bacterium]|nr:HD domain-containing protein [Pseudomonadota bacterium]
MDKKQRALNLCKILGKIKDLKRTGWIRRNVSLPESDADHMFSTAFLTMTLTPPELNKEKCLELVLCHDLQEIYSGDPVPGEKADKEKHQAESKAINQIASELNFPYLKELFEEFEAQKTPEAKFAKIMDKLDTAISAYYYDLTQRTNIPLEKEFFSHAIKEIEKIDSSYKSIGLEILQNLSKE